MIEASAHQIFLMLVNAAATVKDIQTGKRLAAQTIANVLDIDHVCLDDYGDDMNGMANMVNQYISWQYGEADCPTWIVFYNGEHK